MREVRLIIDTAKPPTRRQVLVGLAAGTGLLAGCVTGDDHDDDGDGTTIGHEIPDGVTRPVLGDPEADVTLEVYADVRCPACVRYAEEGFPEIEAAYLDDRRIRYEHRDFVVTGVAAGHAASAMREVFERHGNPEFWPFQSALYEQQERLDDGIPGLFDEVAADRGLDAEAVKTARAERTHQGAVDADGDRARGLGVSGTPGFAVDGELVDTSGATSIDDIVGAVSETLDGRLLA